MCLEKNQMNQLIYLCRARSDTKYNGDHGTLSV